MKGGINIKKIFKEKSLTTYWDKDPYDKYKNFINIKTVSLAFVFLEIIGFFISNYLVNTVINLFSGVANGSGNIDYSISNMFRFDNNYFTIVLIVYALLSVIILINCINVYIAYKSNNKGQKGTNRWTSHKELVQQYKAVPIKETEYDGDAGIPIHRDKEKIYIDDSPVNNLILGMTRSGKGETLVFPMIDIYSRSKNKPSLILTDPKLELYLASKETLEKRDYAVYLINISDPVKSSGYNPLKLIIDYYKAGDYGTAEMLTKTFASTVFPSSNTKDEFFSQTATSLLCALIWAHMEDCIGEDNRINQKRKEEAHKKGGKYELTTENERKITLYSIVNLFITLANESTGGDKSVLDDYFNNRPAGNKAKLFFAASGIAGDKTKGSIYATVFSKIDIFSMEKNAKMLAESSINLTDVGFGEKPVAIFIGIPDIDSSNHFLATTFISQLYFSISNEAIKRDGKCKRKVHFILDEFGNMPKFKDIDKWVTVCLGRNIRFNLFLQSYSQLESLYGKEVAETIIGNCGNQIYILVDDMPSAKKFSELVGNKTLRSVSKSGKALSTNVSFSEHFEERPLLNPSELLNLTEGEYVVVRSMKRKDNNNNPITSYPIYNTGEYRALPRYKYLLEYFPQGNTIKDVKTDDRSNINIAARMVDAGVYIDNVFYGNLIDYKVAEVFSGDTQTCIEVLGILNKYDKAYTVDNKLPQLTVGETLKALRELYNNHVIDTKKYLNIKNEFLNSAMNYYEITH